MRAPINKPILTIPPKPLPTPPVNFPGCGQDYVQQQAIEKLKNNFEFSGLDKDGNDQLNRDEFDAGRSPLAKAIDPGKFGRYDKDNDGYVSRDEYHAGKQAEPSIGHKPFTGKLELPKWESKKDIGDLGKGVLEAAKGVAGAKEIVDEVASGAKEAIKDIF
jgi:hypothetical protein